MGGVKNLRIPSSFLTSDEEPPLDRGGGTERLRRRVMAAYAATPSHEKTYPSAAPPGTSRIAGMSSNPPVIVVLSESAARPHSIEDANHVASNRQKSGTAFVDQSLVIYK